MYKRLALLPTVILALVASTVLVGSPADAAPKKNRTPTCITQAEFNAIRVGTMGPPKVREITGISGRIDHQVDTGYWDHSGYTVYYDQFGNPISYSQWLDDPNAYDYDYIDTSSYVSRYDEVRTYTKCRSWKGKDRRASVWFDNYTHSSVGDVLVFSKRAYNMIGSGNRAVKPAS